MTFCVRLLISSLLLALAVCLSATAAAADTRQLLRDNVGFAPPLGSSVPLDLSFVRHNGQKVQLGELFRDRPVILTPVYYKCPMLCGLELNGLVRALRALSLDAGKDFDIVTFSIDPHETPNLAARKRAGYLAQYGRESAEQGWEFLTGSPESVQQLCDALGFRTAYDKASGQYAHAAGIVVCTPDGRLSRYFGGVEFSPRDLRLGLVESSQGTIGTLTDHVQLFCYMYDPTTGKYGVTILAILRTAGTLTVLAMAVGISGMLYQERRRTRGGIALP